MCRELSLDGTEAAAELAVGRGQGGFGVEIELACDIGDREQQVTQLVAHRRPRRFVGRVPVAFADRLFELDDLLANLGERAVDLRPIEAHASRLLGQSIGPDQRGQRPGHAGEQSRRVIAGDLAALPCGTHGIGIGQALVTEHVGVAFDHLVVDAANAAAEVESPGLLGEGAEKGDLEEQVSQFLGQRFPGALFDRAVDRVGDLVRLLEEIRSKVFEALFPVPRTTVRAAQPANQGHQVVELGGRMVGHQSVARWRRWLQYRTHVSPLPIARRPRKVTEPERIHKGRVLVVAGSAARQGRLIALLVLLVSLGGSVIGAAPAAAVEEIAGFAVTTPVRQSLRELYDEWQSWKRAYYQNDPTTAASALGAILRVASDLGLERLPDLSVAAAAYAVRAAEAGDSERAAWVLEASTDLDASRPETAFAQAMVRRSAGDYLGALSSTVEGYGAALRLADEREVWLQNLKLWALYLLLISGALFIIVQMIVKGADVVHDLQRLVAPPLPFWFGYSLALAVLLWPFLLPSGLLWALCLWGLLLWGYGSGSERAALVAILIILGVTPTILRQQQYATQVRLSSPLRVLEAMGRNALYGELFVDLQVLRSLLPSAPAVLELEADLHRRFGQWELARGGYHELLEREPANAAVANNLGVYYFRRGDFGSATTYFERATQADAQQVEGYFNLNRALSQSYAFGEARQALARAKEIDGALVDSWLEGDEAESRVITVDGWRARQGELRDGLLTAWRAEAPVAMIDRLRNDLSASVMVAIIMLAGAVHLVRRRFGYSFLYVRGPRADSLAGRLQRALVPGLASARDGAGFRSLAGVAIAVAVVLMPVGGDLAFRSRIAFGTATWPVLLMCTLAFVILTVVRVGREFTADE